jgi:cytochrome oxidase assembly protein ShyY1
VLLRPRWVAGHVTVVIVVVAFVLLGFWQLGRAEEKDDAERAARDAYAASAPALGPAGSEPESGARVEVTGTYDPAGEVLLRNRVRDGEGGYDVLTPLVLADGTAIIVDRGWVDRPAAEHAAASVVPPAGTVTVRGPIATPRPLTESDVVDERGGRTSFPRVDLTRIGAHLPYELRAVYVTSQYQEPAPERGQPALPDPPPTDDVNHRSYAFQWFAFALIPLVGWPIVLSRVVKRERPGRQR